MYVLSTNIYAFVVHIYKLMYNNIPYINYKYREIKYIYGKLKAS